MDATLEVVLDGDSTSFCFGAAAGYEFPSRLFVGVAASRFGYEPVFGFSGERFIGGRPSP